MNITQARMFHSGQATISDCERYRYTLLRAWEPTGSRVAFIMLNPSTADAARDDPTIRRCLGFAKQWGYTSLEVGNLFALRATDPKELQRAKGSINGPENDACLQGIANRADMIVAAWGAHPFAATRARSVLVLLNREVVCLGMTRDGHPRHPLYVPADAPLVPYPWRAS